MNILRGRYMNEISIEEVKRQFMIACPELYAYIVLDFNYEGVTENSSAYTSHGAIILKRWLNKNDYSWFVCDIGDSDMYAAIKDFEENFYDDKYTEVYFIGNIPEDYNINGKTVRLKFTCTGKTYDDNDIRLLDKDDFKQMTILTTVSEDDSVRTKVFAGNIMNDYEYAESSDVQILGIFDSSTLAGAVSIADRWGELMHINNIFVSQDYRGRKYATRLIRAATSLCPGVIYTYECHVDNLVSIASAKSADYTLSGTYIVY